MNGIFASAVKENYYCLIIADDGYSMELAVPISKI